MGSPFERKSTYWQKKQAKNYEYLTFSIQFPSNINNLYYILDSCYNRYYLEFLEQNLPNSNFSKFIKDKDKNLDHKKYQISMKRHFPKTNFTKYTLNDPNTGIFKFFTVFGHTKVASLGVRNVFMYFHLNQQIQN